MQNAFISWMFFQLYFFFFFAFLWAHIGDFMAYVRKICWYTNLLNIFFQPKLLMSIRRKKSLK